MIFKGRANLIHIIFYSNNYFVLIGIFHNSVVLSICAYMYTMAQIPHHKMDEGAVLPHKYKGGDSFARKMSILWI